MPSHLGPLFNAFGIRIFFLYYIYSSRQKFKSNLMREGFKYLLQLPFLLANEVAEFLCH